MCSTDSNFSSVSTHYHHMAGYDPATGQQQFPGGRAGYGHRRQHRLHQRRNHVGVEKLSNSKPPNSNSEKIYSTFKPGPVSQSPAPPATPDRNKSTGIKYIFHTSLQMYTIDMFKPSLSNMKFYFSFVTVLKNKTLVL